MADSATFEWVCNELEQRTSLDRLEARGTVRLALKQAGLEPRSVTTEQMKVVLEKVLPSELDSRGVEEHAAVCAALASGVESVASDAAPSPDSPDEVFRRLGG